MPANVFLFCVWISFIFRSDDDDDDTSQHMQHERCMNDSEHILPPLFIFWGGTSATFPQSPSKIGGACTYQAGKYKLMIG